MATQDHFKKGSIINNLDNINNDSDFHIFHAATKGSNGVVLANGGRVLSVTAKNKSLQAALNKIYIEIEKIDWSEGYYRKDIGYRALSK